MIPRRSVAVVVIIRSSSVVFCRIVPSGERERGSLLLAGHDLSQAKEAAKRRGNMRLEPRGFEAFVWSLADRFFLQSRPCILL